MTPEPTTADLVEMRHWFQWQAEQAHLLGNHPAARKFRLAVKAADRLAALAPLEPLGRLVAATERGFTVERLPAPRMDGVYWFAFDRSNRGAVFFGATAEQALAALADALGEDGGT